MSLSVLKQRLQKFFEPSLPVTACEITRQFLSVVRLSSNNLPEVEQFSVVPLPGGLVTPSLAPPNISSPPDLVHILKTALAKAEIKTNKISLAVPDACAKVAIHHFDSLPGKEKDKLQLLKWKLKKTLPFNVEDSHLSYLEQRTVDGKHTVVTVSIHKEVLAQFEGVFEALGIHVGYVTLASFAAFELLARSDSAALQKSVLFLRVRPADVSSLIVQQGAVVFFRHVDYDVGEPSSVEHGPAGTVGFRATDLYDEIHPCLMYYQDKLGAAGVEKIYLSDVHNPDPSLLSSLSQRSRSSVFSLDPARLFRWQPPGELDDVKNALTPSLGLAMGKF
jgi:hypothetical protein